MCSANKWAHALLKCLDLVDKSFPRKLITNRDLKFFSQFWTILFSKLGVKLLYNTAYYPQIDRSSKCTNQIVKIALCFFVYTLGDPSC